MHLAGLDSQIQSVERNRAAEALHNTLGVDDRCHAYNLLRPGPQAESLSATSSAVSSSAMGSMSHGREIWNRGT